MTNTELTAGLGLIHDPNGINFPVTRVREASDNFDDDGYIELTHRGLTYRFDELEDAVNFVTSYHDEENLRTALRKIDERLDALEGD